MVRLWKNSNAAIMLWTASQALRRFSSSSVSIRLCSVRGGPRFPFHARQLTLT